MPPTRHTNSVFRCKPYPRAILFPLHFFVLSLGALGQTAQVGGTVSDAKTGETLPFANIFINNSTLGVAADDKGVYVLKGIPAGSHEIVFSFVGYESYQRKIQIAEGEVLILDVKLIPLEQQLENVEVKGSKDKEWQSQLRKFEKIFLGEDKNASKSKIKNPWVLEFKNEDGVFTAEASAPLEIENNGLGYRLFYYLKSFKSGRDGYTILGNSQFEELSPPDANTALNWMRNRENTYFGSARHLFKTILKGKLDEEGYRLYADRYNTMIRSNNFQRELDKNLIPYKLEPVSPGSSGSESIIHWKGRIEVHYLNKETNSLYYKDINHSLSWIEVKSAAIRVNSDGVLMNSSEVFISGDMAAGRIADILPLNYKPGSIIKVQPKSSLLAQKLREKVYVFTDKPYYYQGEAIWLSAFIKYKYPMLHDSLSKTLHVELMNTNMQVVQSLQLPIDSGRAVGNFNLKANVKEGNYLLRAYTTWGLNYGRSEFFSKPLRVINVYQVAVPENAKADTTSSLLSVSLDKPVYKKREKITLTVQLTEEDKDNLSLTGAITVTDAQKVANIKGPDILNRFKLSEELPTDVLPEFKYPIERGVWLSGTFLNARGKSEQTMFTLIHEKLDGIYQTTSDAQGHFVIKDMLFTDSTTFGVQTKKGSFGRLALDKPQIPFVPSRMDTLPAKVISKENVQRIISNWELPKDAILLKEVEVKDTKIEDTQNYVNPYGKPEFYLKSDKIQELGGDLISIFQRLPGYKVVFTENHWYVFRQRSEVSNQISRTAPREPLMLIDNVQFYTGSGETVGDRLLSMDGNFIDHIEVSSVAGALTGANGTSGLIAIYTKKGGNTAPSKIKSIKLKGYDVPDQFTSPDYGHPTADESAADYRATLYWNPKLLLNKTGTGSVSFFASDLIGTYRILIEGVTHDGRPVRSVTYFQVVD